MLQPKKCCTNAEAPIAKRKIDDDEHAVAELDGYVAKGYVKSFGSIDDLTHYVDGEVVLSNIVIIEKARPDGTIKGGRYSIAKPVA